MKYIFATILSVFFISCSVHKKSTDNVSVMAVEGYEDYNVYSNEEGTYMLLTRNIDESAKYPFNRLLLVVYSKIDKRIIFSDELRDGKVIWKSNNIIYATFSVVVQSNDPLENSTEYEYDVVKNRKKRLLPNP